MSFIMFTIREKVYGKVDGYLHIILIFFFLIYLFFEKKIDFDYY